MSDKENISEHITYYEATHSNKAVEKGLDNTPSAEQLENMKLVALMCFEPTRKWYGKPIHINSFFRSPEVNKAVNGSPTSDHPKGNSIDFTAGSREENLKIFNWMKANLIFDQLIWENDGEWIHVSFRKAMNRNQVLNLHQIVA
jgi:zinc D-Ala-D-Ala carboxypeptidase